MSGKAPVEPFEITVVGGVAVFANFSPEIRLFYADLERELPIVSDAVRRESAQGHERFIFDLRSVSEYETWPVAKWGALHGALVAIRRRYPQSDQQLGLAQFQDRVRLVGKTTDPGMELYIRNRILIFCDTADEAYLALKRAEMFNPDTPLKIVSDWLDEHDPANRAAIRRMDS